MSDEEIRERAVGAVTAVKGEASEEEIEAAIAEIARERDGEDRSGE